jgi:hypothetical protein
MLGRSGLVSGRHKHKHMTSKDSSALFGAAINSLSILSASCRRKHDQTRPKYAVELAVLVCKSSCWACAREKMLALSRHPQYRKSYFRKTRHSTVVCGYREESNHFSSELVDRSARQKIISEEEIKSFLRVASRGKLILIRRVFV